MSNINRNIFFLLLACVCVLAQAQDELFPLKGSSVLMHAWKQRNEQAATQKQQQNQSAQSVTAQFLPFYDDFSYYSTYPDPNRWVNSYSVFVNRTKATTPITLGVATFDGMKSNGFPYNPGGSTTSNPSDTLTSIPLRLDSLNGVDILPTDSVTLRFYYQARGIWEKPDAGDDLILEFYKRDQTPHWVQVWSASGGVAPSNSNFKRVMIAITDTAYLKNGFQFRFRNYSSNTGDVDHWHIDQVFMDKKLNPNKDTIIGEMSFSFNLQSLLKNYSQMPYKQFAGYSDMVTRFDVQNNLRNNFTQNTNIKRGWQIRDRVGNIVMVSPDSSTAYNFSPYNTAGYYYIDSLLSPSLRGYTYNNGVPFTDSTSYLVKFYDTWPSDPNTVNDTIYYRQKFHNYYAYDDGTAETGYGIGQNGCGSTYAVGSYTAVRYQLNLQDTLRAIDIYFDPTFDVASLQNAQIWLYVWSDNGGIPGNVLRVDSTTFPYPVFSTSGYDVFQRYQLATPVYLNANSTFYIGVRQQLPCPLYIGYDLNTDHHTQVLFRTPNLSGNSGWNTSTFAGSLMMHPVFGDSLRAVHVKENPLAESNRVVLYPNPASEVLNVSCSSPISRIVICDMLGNVVADQQEREVNISMLPSGVYLVKTFTSKGFCDIQKLLITR